MAYFAAQFDLIACGLSSAFTVKNNRKLFGIVFKHRLVRMSDVPYFFYFLPVL